MSSVDLELCGERVSIDRKMAAVTQYTDFRWTVIGRVRLREKESTYVALE